MDLTLQQEVILFAATYMIIAAGVVEKTVRSFCKKRIFNEYLLILIATACSFLIFQYVEGIFCFYYCFRLVRFLKKSCCTDQRIYCKYDGHCPGVCKSKES